jgi:hypothetical protein
MIINVADYRQNPQLALDLVNKMLGDVATGVFEIAGPRAGDSPELLRSPAPSDFGGHEKTCEGYYFAFPPGQVCRCTTGMLRTIADLQRQVSDWKGSFFMYRDAWRREIGHDLIPKGHEIDALVLTTRWVLAHGIGGKRDAGTDMLKKKPEPPDLRHLATIFRDIFTKPGIAGDEGRLLMAMHQLQELLRKPELTVPPRDEDPHICATCSATCKITHTSEKCLG